MSGYILCQTKRAQVPYYIENISTNIYSIEELCYFLHQNLYLVDCSIVNEGLCRWLEDELELTKLAAKIRPHIGKFADVEDVLYPIFKEINYLSYEELRELNRRIAVFNAESPVIREKKKGDSLVENGMYVSAIQVYRKLLENPQLEKVRAGLTESVFHNLGCAYSYLFQMEKALECFFKAWECNKSSEAMKAYLLAYKSAHTADEFKNRLNALAVDGETRAEVAMALEEFAKIPEKKVEPDQIDTQIRQFIRDYHRSTGS